ncbi:ParB family protein [Thauera phenylacetica B4P]|uniref:ParB family protein n=1 Tax=Thauera phenylacetica B4P TaxID=1234382 RepID=N6ZXF2_9RHOO|nr:PRTRC system ParB family protein [Thauera phenylacetica]ENO99167.1 ParB family protein [Thauera phenylacetica B4P]
MDAPANPTLPLRRIVQGRNPRTYFDPAEMADLRAGLKAAGRVVQPIIVRPIPNSNLFEIVAGERRWRAAKEVFGEDYDMPVVIEALNDEEAEAIAVIENHHRAPMSHAEEAHAAKRMLIRYKGDKDEAAATLGWKPDLLERRLALLTCTPAVLEALTHRQIQLGHAELLAGVPPDKQDTVLAGVLAHKVPVGALKEQLGRFARRLADAIFDTAQCSACPHNSARQSGLFDESLGEGYCQHPTHYDELTTQAIEAKAQGLREQYPMVRIVRASDGFTPLPVTEDGALGVGPQQYGSCKGCAAFGCAVSALPGSLGEVTASLCFDAGCNSQKVAAWRKARRDDMPQAPEKAPKTIGKASARKAAAPAPARTAPAPSNQTPQRVKDFRVAQWRKWAARELMAQPERNRRVMIALARCGRTGDVRTREFGAAAKRIAGPWVLERLDFAAALPEADAIGAQHVEQLMLAVTASAAFGVNPRDLEAMLSYLDVDERKHFKWNAEFLELFTMSELESLAGEVGLKQKMGAAFKLARAKKKGDFIQSLLAVPGFAYDGTVPAVMQYPRKPTASGLIAETSEASVSPAVEASDDSVEDELLAA